MNFYSKSPPNPLLQSIRSILFTAGTSGATIDFVTHQRPFILMFIYATAFLVHCIISYQNAKAWCIYRLSIIMGEYGLKYIAELSDAYIRYKDSETLREIATQQSKEFTHDYYMTLPGLSSQIIEIAANEHVDEAKLQVLVHHVEALYQPTKLISQTSGKVDSKIPPLSEK